MCLVTAFFEPRTSTSPRSGPDGSISQASDTWKGSGRPVRPVHTGVGRPARPRIAPRPEWCAEGHGRCTAPIGAPCVPVLTTINPGPTSGGARPSPRVLLGTFAFGTVTTPSTRPPGRSTTTAPGSVITITGGPNATTNIPGPHNDAADFYGIALALIAIMAHRRHPAGLRPARRPERARPASRSSRPSRPPSRRARRPPTDRPTRPGDRDQRNQRDGAERHPALTRGLRSETHGAAGASTRRARLSSTVS